MHYILLFAAFQMTQPEPARAPPIDRCSTDASFVEFRGRLVDAIDRKDVASLERLVDPNIQISFGPDGQGWSEFFRQWELDQPADSGLRLELAEALRLGCDDYEHWRLAPGNFKALWEYDGLPPHFAVETGAPLRTRPDDTAPVVMRLDYHVLLEVPDNDPSLWPNGWLHARLTDGRSGFVRMWSVRSAIDYRAAFEKIDGKWVLASFVAGD